MAVALPDASGVLYVHSAPAAIVPHVEWAVERALGYRPSWGWGPQPVSPGALRAVVEWVGRPGTAGRIASVLREWDRVRFEVTEDATTGPGDRYSWTPTLGLFHAMTAGNGDVLVGEDQLRDVLARAAAGQVDLAAECTRLLGQAWDLELEAFRAGGEHADGDAPVRWLHEVG